MAEVAGSIVGLVAFGGHALQASIELKQLWSALRDAPEDIKYIINEISNLDSLLAALKEHHDAFAPFAIPSPIWEDSRQRCSSVASDLEKIALDLKHKIQHSRTGGSVRVLFKKDVLAKYTARLAVARSDLNLAQSVFNSSVQLRQLAESFKHSALLETVDTRAQSTITSQVSHTSKQLAILESSTSLEQSMSSPQQLSSTSENALIRAKRKKREQASIRKYSIQARWLGKLFQVHVNVATCPWGINVMPHNMLSRSAPIWTMLDEGDVDGMRKLFSSRAASIFDATVYGDTLLDYAVQWCGSEVVQTLLQEGAPVTLKTLKKFYGWRRLAERVSQTTRLARLLISYSDQLLIDNLDEFDDMRFNKPCNVAESVQILLSEAFPPYRSRPISERAHMAFDGWVFTDDTFFLWLGQDVIDGSCLCVLSKDEASYRSLLAFIGYTVGERRSTQIAAAVAQRMEIIRQSIKAGGIDAAYECDETILLPFLQQLILNHRRGFGISNMEQVNMDVVGWLTALVDAGADLERIAAGERCCFQKLQKLELQYTSIRFPEINKISVVGLRTGHRLEEWQYYFSNPLDEWACDFWHLLEEGSELSIPGSWVDEEDEREARVRAKPGLFRSLATSRRKRRRYLRMMGLTDEQARENLGPGWDCLLSINTLRRGDVLITASDIKWCYHGHWPQLGDPYGRM